MWVKRVASISFSVFISAGAAYLAGKIAISLGIDDWVAPISAIVFAATVLFIDR